MANYQEKYQRPGIQELEPNGPGPDGSWIPVKDKTKDGDCPSHIKSQMKIAMPIIITILIITLILLIPWLKHRKKNEQIRLLSKLCHQ